MYIGNNFGKRFKHQNHFFLNLKDNTFGWLQNGHESGTAEEPPRVCRGVEETGEPVLPLRAAPV